MLKSLTYTYCQIKNNACLVDDETVFSAPQDTPAAEFLNLLYKKTDLNYPKFFKMDIMCKLGILASEFLLKNLSEEDAQDTAILLSNNASSLHTDRRHFENIKSETAYFPSPSVFVYTLPNIVIGEISIKHKITGEGVFFLSENHNFENSESYINLMLDSGIAKRVLSGFVEADGDIVWADLRLYEKNN